MNVPSLDVDGYLVDPSEWSEDWARATADAMNVTLTDEHWEAIRFMRKYYDEHQVAPDARFVMRHLSRNARRVAQPSLRTVPIRLPRPGLQDRGNAQAARLEHRLSDWRRFDLARERQDRLSIW